jgi:hypothetical protein
LATKADFNADEWSKLAEGPLLAGMRVVTSTRGGTIRESVAIAKVYTAARQSQGDSELIDQLVASPPAIDPQQLQGAGDAATVSRERLRESLAVLQQKGAPEDVSAYREFVLAVARAAAEAHKEGGFIGIGGREISAEEQAALDEIRAELDGGGGAAAG